MAQAPTPLQALLAPMQVSSSSPLGTGVQVPTFPGTLQAKHSAVHAVPQQKPSAQAPLWQSLAIMQGWSPHFVGQLPPQSWPASIPF
jgi:hypothetical protein